MAADLEHDKFYDELPAAMRADVAAEITKEIFDSSCFLSVLVCYYLSLSAACFGL